MRILSVLLQIMAAGDLMGKVIATNTSNELCRMTMAIFAAVCMFGLGVLPSFA